MFSQFPGDPSETMSAKYSLVGYNSSRKHISISIPSSTEVMSPHIKSVEELKVLGINLSSFSAPMQFFICVAGVFIFYLIYGYLQVTTKKHLSINTEVFVQLPCFVKLTWNMLLHVCRNWYFQWKDSSHSDGISLWSSLDSIPLLDLWNFNSRKTNAGGEKLHCKESSELVAQSSHHKWRFKFMSSLCCPEYQGKPTWS